jgi:hypothetical protein
VPFTISSDPGFFTGYLDGRCSLVLYHRFIRIALMTYGCLLRIGTGSWV